MIKYFNSIYVISIHTPARGVTTTVTFKKKSSDISIHTPARGVTVVNVYIVIHLKISIHTPARGVTSSLYDYFLFHQHFNPHSRKGSDHDSTKRCTPFLISIHTPARGVTGQVISYGRFAIDFNPHSRKGSDAYGRKSLCFPCRFQSTLPQGE